ncbi:hypothetical protein Tco_0980428 [Tanacetum coccineum]
MDMVGQIIQKKEEEKRIAEEQASKDRYWKIPICYDDDEDYTIAITPESDEYIKFSVEILVPIPSESEGVPEMCDVPFHDNSPPLEASKDQFKDFFESNDESTSSDDDSFSIDDIDYVDASPPDAEIVSLEVVEIVAPEISSGSTTTRSDYSLPDYEAFYSDDDHIKEKISGSTTTHADFSQYDSFIFGISINPFPPANRSDFYHEEFADELAHIIYPPEYDHFCFKIELELGNLTMDVVNDIFPTREPKVHVLNVLPTHPTLDLDFILSSESLFAYVV